MANDDHYSVLGLPPTATADEIRKAHRRLARLFHPDMNPNNPAAVEQFKRVQAAYEVLSDVQRRRQFDRGEGSVPPPEPEPPRRAAQTEPDDEATFTEVPRRGRDDHGYRRRTHHAVPDVPEEKVDGVISVPFSVSARGGVVSVQYSRGSDSQVLELQVPPGVKTGSILRLSASAMGYRRERLAVRVQVEDDPIYTREGLDIVVDIKVTLYEALLGGTVDVPTVDGDTIRVHIPPGSSSGRRLRIPGHGIFRGNDRGDMQVSISIVVPHHLDHESKRMLAELEARNPVSIPKRVRGI